MADIAVVNGVYNATNITGVAPSCRTCDEQLDELVTYDWFVTTAHWNVTSYDELIEYDLNNTEIKKRNNNKQLNKIQKNEHTVIDCKREKPENWFTQMTYTFFTSSDIDMAYCRFTLWYF